jgi:MFS family permease
VTGGAGTGGTMGSSRWSRRLGPFAIPSFAAYWLGGLLSNTGTWLQAVAASVFVYQLTGSVFMVGVLNFVSFLPIVLFSVYGGSLADRRDRRWIVIVTSAIAGVLALGLGLVALAGLTEVWPVILVGFLLNTVYAITKPSITSLLPDLVPSSSLDEAVSLNTLQFILGQMIGPLLAALVLATVGAGEAFIVNGLTFIGPILAMAYLLRRGLGAQPRRRKAAGASGQAPAESPDERVRAVDVVGYIRDHVWIGYMLLTVICTSAAMEVARTTAPALAAEQLGVGESGAGVIVAAQSLGSAIGVLAFVAIRARADAAAVATVGLAVQAMGLVLLAMSTSLVMASLAVGLVGVGFSLAFPVPTSSLQRDVDAAYRGRVMSVHQISHLGNRPFSALAIGAIAAGFGLPMAALAAVALLPLGYAALRRGWRGRPLPAGDLEPAA